MIYYLNENEFNKLIREHYNYDEEIIKNSILIKIRDKQTNELITYKIK